MAMRRSTPAGLAVLVPLLAACASGAPPSDPYWRNAAGDRADFSTDNVGCSAAATRVKPTPRADQLPGGATVIDNRVDRPPKRWVSSVAENTYMDCMAERGWQLVRR
jgi:hypothetical protein